MHAPGFESASFLQRSVECTASVENLVKEQYFKYSPTFVRQVLAKVETIPAIE